MNNDVDGGGGDDDDDGGKKIMTTTTTTLFRGPTAGPTAGAAPLGGRGSFPRYRPRHPADIEGYAHDHLLSPPHEGRGHAAHHGETEVLL